MSLRSSLLAAIVIAVGAVSFASDSSVAQEPTGTAKVDEQPIDPPKPGPELLKFTPEQIEKAYEGKTIPEAVSMYLVIARGGNWMAPTAGLVPR